jgi:pilus assembly protein Flp/PilA
MTTMLKNLWNDQSGASAAEYALILAIVGVGIAAAALTLGGAIGGAMNKASNCINAPSNTTC